jgi:hypothetical protein
MCVRYGTSHSCWCEVYSSKFYLSCVQSSGCFFRHSPFTFLCSLQFSSIILICKIFFILSFLGDHSFCPLFFVPLHYVPFILSRSIRPLSFCPVQFVPFHFVPKSFCPTINSSHTFGLLSFRFKLIFS